jgi:hypothetical protein
MAIEQLKLTPESLSNSKSAATMDCFHGFEIRCVKFRSSSQACVLNGTPGISNTTTYNLEMTCAKPVKNVVSHRVKPHKLIPAAQNLSST